MVTTLLIKGHRKWAVSPSHSFICIHTHTESPEKDDAALLLTWRIHQLQGGRMYMWAASSLLPAAVSVGFPRATRQQDCTSRTAFPQDTSGRVSATRVHQTVKFSILVLKISHCFIYKVLKVCLGSDCCYHHWRGWVFFFNFQPRRVTSFPMKVSQAQFFLMLSEHRLG